MLPAQSPGCCNPTGAIDMKRVFSPGLAAGCKDELSCPNGFELSSPISLCGATACDGLGSSYIASSRTASTVITRVEMLKMNYKSLLDDN